MTSAIHREQDQENHYPQPHSEAEADANARDPGHDVNFGGLQRSWDRLRRTGLAQKSVGPGELTVLDAGDILGALLARCRSALAARDLEITAAVWGLERLLASAELVLPVDSEDVELITGAQNVQRTLADVNGLAATSRLSLLQEPIPVGHMAVVLQDCALAERGVGVRTVYQGDRTLSPGQDRRLHRLTGAGIKVRLAPLVPINLIIVDRSIVVLPADPDRPADALVVLRSAAWAYLAGLIFEEIWQCATPSGR